MMYPWVDKANKIFIYVLCAQFLLSLFIAFFTNTWTESLLIGTSIIAVPLLLIKQSPHAKLTRHVVALAVQMFTALHIQQSLGLTEIHFEIFVVLAFLGFYRDWQIIFTALVFIAVHHVLFFILQGADLPVYIFEEGHLFIYLLLIHAGFAATEAIVLMFVAKASFNEAQASLEMSEKVDQILESDGSFNLSIELNENNPELKAFNSLITAFAAFIGHAKSVNTNVANMSENIVELSQGVEEATNASNEQIHMIATATEEMTVANEDVATRASQVNDSAQSASNQSSIAKEIVTTSSAEITSLKEDVSNAAKSIEQLADKCGQIEQVMSAIKSISDQTNLLALNAAIESARAGEHGRGFAVVADEVRQLAMKTRDNAEEISEITSVLIGDASDSVNQMKTCVVKADTVVDSTKNVSQVIDDVVNEIGGVSDNISSVATAAEEQTSVSVSISSSTVELKHTSEQLKDFSDSTNQGFAELKVNIDNLNSELNRFVV